MQRFVHTRIIHDISDGIQGLDEYVLICMSRFVWGFLRDLAFGYGLRDTSYATAYYADGYDIPTAAEFDQIDETISAFLAEDDMTCNLVDALTALTTVLSGCTCGNSGSLGAPSSEPAASTFTDNDEDYPAGFSDVESYKTGKCSAANYIIAAIEQDFEYLQTISITSLVATSLAVAFATPIPFDDIVAIAAIVGSFILEAAWTTLATEIIDWIGDNQTELVCDIYTAADAETAKQNVLDRAETDLTSPAFYLFEFFVTYSAVNKAFSYDVQTQNTTLTASVDCRGCFEDHFSYYGNQIGPAVWESELISGIHHVAIAFYSDNWTTSSEPTRLLNVALGAMPGFTGVTDSTHAYRARTTMTTGAECVGWDVYCTDTKPTGSNCLKKLDLRSSTPFTVTFAFGSDC